MQWPLAPGTGSSGSPWMCTRPTGGMGCHMSISGPSSRSGASSAAPSSASARIAPSTMTRLRPRRGSGIWGKSGSCIRRAEVVTSSGRVLVHFTQRPRTSGPRSQSQAMAPP